LSVGVPFVCVVVSVITGVVAVGVVVAAVAVAVVVVADELGAVAGLGAGFVDDMLADEAADVEVAPAVCLALFVLPGRASWLVVATVRAPQPVNPDAAATSATNLRAYRIAPLDLAGKSPSEPGESTHQCCRHARTTPSASRIIARPDDAASCRRPAGFAAAAERAMRALPSSRLVRKEPAVERDPHPVAGWIRDALHTPD
jgi:hypothetical protein